MTLRWATMSIALIAAACCAACALTADPPPIDLSYRDSLVGAGKIIQIRNTSNEALAELRIRIAAPSGDERTFNLETLEPYATFELGWKRLGGWEIPTGATVEVTCEGHVRPRTGTVESPHDGGQD